MSRCVTTIERAASVGKNGGVSKIAGAATPGRLRGAMWPRLRKGSAALTQPAIPKYVNQPVSPCSSGVQPVYDVVIADAVVDGKTEVSVRLRRRASSLAAPWRRR